MGGRKHRAQDLRYKLLFWNNFSVGVAPLVIGIFFFSSVQLISVGLLGEYIGSIHTRSRSGHTWWNASASISNMSRTAQNEALDGG